MIADEELEAVSGAVDALAERSLERVVTSVIAHVVVRAARVLVLRLAITTADQIPEKFIQA